MKIELSEEQKIKYMYEASEKYAVQAEMEEAEWHKSNDENLKRYLVKVDELLIKNDFVGFLHLVDDESTIVRFGKSSEFAWVCLIAEIVRLEATLKFEPGIISHRKNRREVIKEIDELRFLFWRIEFAEDEEAINELYEYIVRTNVSPAAFSIVLDSSAYNKDSMYILMMEFLDAIGKPVHKYMLESKYKGQKNAEK